MTRDSIFFYALPYLKSKTGWVTVCFITAAFFFKRQASAQIISHLFSAFSSKKWLLAALLIASVSRILWTASAPYETYTSWKNLSTINESDIINIQALQTAQGMDVLNADGTPSGRRPFGYIYFLGFLYKIFGPSKSLPTISQWLLTLLFTAIFFTFLSAHFPKGIAAISCLLTALYPPLVISVNIVLDEYLFIPLWVLGMLIYLTPNPRLSWGKTIILGAVWGLSTVVRTQSIAMPAVIFLTSILLKQPIKSTALKCLVMLTILLSVNLPIAARNYRVWGVPVYYTATGGFIYSMLNPFSRGDITRIPQKGEPYYSEAFHTAPTEGAAHVEGLRMARKWIVENPGDFLHLSAQKLLWFFSPDNSEWAVSLHETAEGRNGYRLPDKFKRMIVLIEKNIQTFFVFSFFNLMFLAICFKKNQVLPLHPGSLLLFFSILSWTALHTLTNPYVKYRLPLDLLLFPMTLYLFNFVFEDKTPPHGYPA